ncbi:MAG: TetR/AcrR family transcriptional regulator [Mesorhizobium sp.]|nr:TetR/AcrR family transcriptional regulator [Mesorhizobium sp.]MCO5161640.1 TetR/AcrR family transcriptional regulator [Mesorhizobium sp.]
MNTRRANSRDRILTAAEQVARESGPGSLSLDAVAQRAGVSKGGLLYNFPTKTKLMQGLAARHVEDFQRDLDEAVAAGEPLIAAYLRLTVYLCDKGENAAWIFSAVAEDPDVLQPIIDHRRRLLDRLKAESANSGAALVVFFSMEGLLSMKLFGTFLLDANERDTLLRQLSRMVEDAATDTGMSS